MKIYKLYILIEYSPLEKEPYSRQAPITSYWVSGDKATLEAEMKKKQEYFKYRQHDLQEVGAYHA